MEMVEKTRVREIINGRISDTYHTIHLLQMVLKAIIGAVADDGQKIGLISIQIKHMIAIPVIGVLIGGGPIFVITKVHTGKVQMLLDTTRHNLQIICEIKQEIGLYGLQNKQLSMDTDGMQ